jgi:hypothetical protein
MRWDHVILTAFGGIAALVIGGVILLDDARSLFAPVVGMVGGIAALALANHERLKLRMDALEKQLAQRESRERWKRPCGCDHCKNRRANLI